MRHRNHSGRLGVDFGHRRAMLANLATALLTHGRIETTQAKARAVRPYVEKLITLGKRGDVHARRQALGALGQRQVVDRLFNDVAPVFAARTGGYTRMIKTGFRAGDAAPMAVVELVGEAVATESGAKAPAKEAATKKAATKKAATKDTGAKEVAAKEDATKEAPAEEAAAKEAATKEDSAEGAAAKEDPAKEASA